MIRNLSDELRDTFLRAGSKVVSLQHKLVEFGVTKGVFIKSDPKTLSEVIWSTFFGIVLIERSKHIMSRKNTLDVTKGLAIEILKRGILNNT